MHVKTKPPRVPQLLNSMTVCAAGTLILLAGCTPRGERGGGRAGQANIMLSCFAVSLLSPMAMSCAIRLFTKRRGGVVYTHIWVYVFVCWLHGLSSKQAGFGHRQSTHEARQSRNTDAGDDGSFSSNQHTRWERFSSLVVVNTASVVVCCGDGRPRLCLSDMARVVSLIRAVQSPPVLDDRVRPDRAPAAKTQNLYTSLTVNGDLSHIRRKRCVHG